MQEELYERTCHACLFQVATTFSRIFILLLICGKLVMCIQLGNYIGCKRQMVIEADDFLQRAGCYCELWVIYFVPVKHVTFVKVEITTNLCFLLIGYRVN